MIEITEMTAGHVTQIAELERLCFSDPWSEKSIAAELENDLSLWLVALDGDAVVGYVGSQSVLGETDMMNIAVSPDHRREQIGERLIVELISKLKEKGNHSLMLEVRASNIPAQMLYEKLGFALAGRRPKYYHNPREDALILRKEWEI
ncbi:MAG: ribosomal protein S18-alanine N-acetyltransferase [Oscillospiraceae bacterium]|nr:ribosomal protein S18-alanine N-acetyltransferase [Oscillospiraceae bacterium]